MFPGVLAELDAHMTAVRLLVRALVTCVLSLLLEIDMFNFLKVFSVPLLTTRTCRRLGYWLPTELRWLQCLWPLAMVSPMLELPTTCLVRVVELALQIGMPIVLTVVSVKLSMFYLKWAVENSAIVLFPLMLNVTRFPVVVSIRWRNLLAATSDYVFGLAPCVVTAAVPLAWLTCLASSEHSALLLPMAMLLGEAHLSTTAGTVVALIGCVVGVATSGVGLLVGPVVRVVPDRLRVRPRGTADPSRRRFDMHLTAKGMPLQAFVAPRTGMKSGAGPRCCV